MHSYDFLQLGVFFLVILLLMRPLGLYIYKVLSVQERTFLDPLLKPVERGVYRICRIDPQVEQTWKEYLLSLFTLSGVSLMLSFVLLMLQGYLPLNPERFVAPSWHLALNTAVSFVTNTDWQSYGGESTFSYFSQMAVLTVQNFISASVGLGAAAVLVRGLARRHAKTIGNFWVDMVRVSLYLLLPLSIVGAVVFVSEGVPQNFRKYVDVETVEGQSQKIVQGPIASQEAIKVLGSNGGGFTNVNAAHPYENPTPLTNILQGILIVLIPSAQIYYFGRSVHNPLHAWCIFAALSVVFIAGVCLCTTFERVGNPVLEQYGVNGGNLEGKELRFGIFGSSMYACATTAVSCGSVNCAHDALTPIGGLVPLLNMQLSEVIFGGVGAGLYSVLLFIFLAVFVAGLIIGRTPEYLGKKISVFDMKMTVLAILAYIILVHVFTCIACMSRWGIEGLGNRGPHGFTEILYAFSSCAANNGSAFAGLAADSIGYNLCLAIVMWLGRFLVIVPVIALAGSFAEKKVYLSTVGSFPLVNVVFICLLVGVILLVGALTFIPALTMGPIIEQFFMLKRVLFP